MVIDDLRQGFGETIVPHIPVADPGEACVRHARGGIRHLGGAEVGRFWSNDAKRASRSLAGSPLCNA